eukprot:TRINITY_DN406_c0_g1_i1.p2 TRINITY_DN406_c0_g1~~TRINITY_DN406_c0_g1_i1.p2  ORF type:complete len:113 (+),score=0.41 TRINITY_DN406_c0_g1_i1:39-377(+)
MIAALLALVAIFVIGGEAQEVGAYFKYYTDNTCTVEASEALGPCWDGGNEQGYKGYYWQFSCDAQTNIIEYECDTPTSCPKCEWPYPPSEVAGPCYYWGNKFYRWFCVPALH